MSSTVAIATINDGKVSREISGVTSSLGSLNPTQVDGDTAFDLASITKVFCTTTLLMKAVQSDQISVTDSISKFLPAWQSPEKSDLTIEDLLRHESGLEEWRPFYVSCEDAAEAFEMIAQLPLKYPKRKEFHYSDLNFITLGQLLTKIYENSLDQIFQYEIAAPLGLKNTQFATPVNKNQVVATSIGDSIEYKMVESKVPYQVPEQVGDFANWRKEVLSGEINDCNAFHLFAGISGHAGLFSTLNDLSTYALALLEGFIDQTVLKQFSQPRNTPQQGMGFRRFALKDGDFAIGHFGFTGTGFAINPISNQGWVYLSNRLHTTDSYKSMNEIWCNQFKEFSFLG